MTLLDLTPRVVENDRLATLPVAIIGAGPIGLAAAAHLVERGIDFVVLRGRRRGRRERARVGPHPAVLAVEAPRRPRVAAAARGARAGSCPTRSAPRPAPSWSRSTWPRSPRSSEIASRIRTGVEVIGVTREGMDRTRTRARAATPFALRVRTASAERSRTSPRAR